MNIQNFTECLQPDSSERMIEEAVIDPFVLRPEEPKRTIALHEELNLPGEIEVENHFDGTKVLRYVLGDKKREVRTQPYQKSNVGYVRKSQGPSGIEYDELEVSLEEGRVIRARMNAISAIPQDIEVKLRIFRKIEDKLDSVL